MAKPATNLRQGYGWRSQQPTSAKATVGEASNQQPTSAKATVGEASNKQPTSAKATVGEASNQPPPRLRLAKPATNLRQGYGWRSQQPTSAKATVGEASNKQQAPSNKHPATSNLNLNLNLNLNPMPLLIVICGIALLLLLILVFKLNTFIAFIIVALSVALTVGMTIDEAVVSVQKGIGSTMGIIIPVLGFGAMLGKLVSESGAAQRITTRFTGNLDSKYIQTSLMLAGFIVGIALFYEVGFFIMIPLVFTIAASTGLPLIYVGLPMIASLSVTHGYLPPHPAPTALTAMFDADLGLTLLYGLTIAIPAILVSGPLLARFLSRVDAKPLAEFVNFKILTEEEMPGFRTSFFSALLPVILITLSTVAGFIFEEENIIRRVLGFVGNPVVAMLLSVLSAIYFLGIARGRKMTDLMKSLSHSISTVAMIMLMIAGAGSLKQILVDGGVSSYIGGLMSQSMLSPLILGWLIATILRICIGSATVSGLTAAGIVLPLLSGTNVSPELMVLAVGSGSLMCSHVNDTGFWLFKEYFNLSVKETLKTWTIMETSIGISGLIGVMILSLFV